MNQYNQLKTSQHCRIGNWFEELRLQEDTVSAIYMSIYCDVLI